MHFRKKQRKISMTKGPNKILLEILDLTYLHKKEAKSAKASTLIDVSLKNISDIQMTLVSVYGILKHSELQHDIIVMLDLRRYW